MVTHVTVVMVNYLVAMDMKDSVDVTSMDIDSSCDVLSR